MKGLVIIAVLLYATGYSDEYFEISHKRDFSNEILKSISLKYAGPSDKSPPEVILYVDTFDTSGLTYYHAFRVPDSVFTKVELLITESPQSGFVKMDTTKLGPFNVTISIGNSKCRYVAFARKDVESILDRILTHFNDTSLRRRVGYSFKMIKELSWLE